MLSGHRQHPALKVFPYAEFRNLVGYRSGVRRRQPTVCFQPLLPSHSAQENPQVDLATSA
ncbi:hypothetical protein THICB2_30106 [Thiomonas sp. CB2]|nr:hypothetical protein THICB2_30106 [Thiomonas sp. CB2]CQR45413.1 hypothetical protein THICB3620225 [Thiomonas sp. CB3]